MHDVCMIALLYTGLKESCALCRSRQPMQTACVLQKLGGTLHGGNVPPGRPGARKGHGDQPDGGSTERVELRGEITGTV